MAQLILWLKKVNFSRLVDSDWFLPALGLSSIAAIFLLLSTIIDLYSIMNLSTSTTQAATSNAKVKTAINFNSIASAHIFGNAALTLNTDYLPTTEMQLTLQGIFWEPNQKQRGALIANSNGNAKEYYQGDLLPGGATVVKITANNVIISKNSEYEKIEIPNSKLHFSTQASALFEK